MTTTAVEGTPERPPADQPRPQMPSPARALLLAMASLLVSVAFLILIATVLAIVVWILAAAFTSVPEPDRKWPRLSAWAVVAIPIVALVLAFLLNRNGEQRTFYAQKSANRRVSVLLMVVLIGLFVVIGEVIAASLTFDSYWALAGAALAALVGGGAALFAQVGGANTVLSSAGARRLDPASGRDARDVARLGDIVNELSIAADIAPPALYVIDDPAPNAMAVGTNAKNAAIAVTTGMLDKFDREQIQGVIGHELAHIRNLDSRYGVYVAILVGLVALVTDGFLRVVVRAWSEGVFLRGAGASDDARGAVAGLTVGIGLGLVLLATALVLRLFAPIAAVLVQASVSRQREYMADATSVELTRNPVALTRALTALRNDNRVIRRTNRGNQHLWLESPLDKDADGAWHLLATHPTLDARIARLNQLYPAAARTAEPPTAE